MGIIACKTLVCKRCCVTGNLYVKKTALTKSCQPWLPKKNPNPNQSKNRTRVQILQNFMHTFEEIILRLKHRKEQSDLNWITHRVTNLLTIHNLEAK